MLTAQPRTVQGRTVLTQLAHRSRVPRAWHMHLLLAQESRHESWRPRKRHQGDLCRDRYAAPHAGFSTGTPVLRHEVTQPIAKSSRSNALRLRPPLPRSDSQGASEQSLVVGLVRGQQKRASNGPETPMVWWEHAQLVPPAPREPPRRAAGDGARAFPDAAVLHLQFCTCALRLQRSPTVREHEHGPVGCGQRQTGCVSVHLSGPHDRTHARRAYRNSQAVNGIWSHARRAYRNFSL